MYEIQHFAEILDLVAKYLQYQYHTGSCPAACDGIRKQRRCKAAAQALPKSNTALARFVLRFMLPTSRAGLNVPYALH